MTIKATITGRISEPRLRSTRAGEVLSFGIAATPRRENKQTGQWEDRGAPLWVEVTLWEQAAQRWQHLLEKGTQVAVSVDALALAEYVTGQGEQRTKLEAVNPRVLGIIPADTQGGRAGTPAGNSMAWNNPGGFTGGTGHPGAFDDAPPF